MTVELIIGLIIGAVIGTILAIPVSMFLEEVLFRR